MSLAPTIYRQALRLLPRGSSLAQHVRRSIAAAADAADAAPALAVQGLAYVRAQQAYVALLRRYNPGLEGAADEGVRAGAAARRVGVEMPREYRRR
jgi:hypothetical protein